jgi:hypothetical protein
MSKRDARVRTYEVGYLTLERALARAEKALLGDALEIALLTDEETAEWQAYLRAEEEGRRSIPAGAPDARRRFQALYDRLETDRIRTIQARRYIEGWARNRVWQEIRLALVTGALEGYGYVINPDLDIRPVPQAVWSATDLSCPPAWINLPSPEEAGVDKATPFIRITAVEHFLSENKASDRIISVALEALISGFLARDTSPLGDLSVPNGDAQSWPERRQSPPAAEPPAPGMVMHSAILPIAKGRRGRKPSYEWSLMQAEAFRLLDEYGMLGPDNPALPTQDAFIKRIEEHYESKKGRDTAPSYSRLADYVGKWVREWVAMSKGQ